MTQRPRFPHCALLCLVVLTLAGCVQSDGGMEVSAEADAPAEFTFSGTSWQRGSGLTSEEESLLMDWFRQHPDVIGSAELEGDPIVYRTESEDCMFVWTYPAANGGGWTRLHCRQGTIQQESGSGSPF